MSIFPNRCGIRNGSRSLSSNRGLRDGSISSQAGRSIDLGRERLAMRSPSPTGRCIFPRFGLLAAWASLVVSACSPGGAEPPGDRAIDANEALELTGSISSESLERLKRSLTLSTRRLIVNSAGGRIPEAIQLGALVRSYDLEVVVDGICLSACAHFIFLPAKRKRLQPNSVVAFHQTATAISDVLASSARPELAAVYLPVAEQEQNFYRSAGISRSALVDPFLMIKPTCYWESKERPMNSEYRTSTVTEFTFYVPALQELYDLGVSEIAGTWPASIKDVERSLSRYPRQLNATFKMKLDPSRDIGKAAARSIPICPADPRSRPMSRP